MPRITHVKKARVRRYEDGTEKPNLKCERHGTEIKPGDPYKWMSIKTGPMSSRKLIRCAACPTWQPWEYSNALWARLAQIVFDFENSLAEIDNTDDLDELLAETAGAIRDIAEEKREAASNIEDGFGHATEKSDELTDIADNLDGWADEFENASYTEFPEGDECEHCGGTGKIATEEDIEEWRQGLSGEFNLESPV